MVDGQPIAWQPNPGQQTAFLACTADEVCYGGSAGGGKTDALLVDPLRFIHHPNANGILFRRTFPELEGFVIPRSRDIYEACGGKYNQLQHRWAFPSGARQSFGHLQGVADITRYQGTPFTHVAFDELTTFLEEQYLYLLSRLRSAHGVPLRFRSGTNPGGPGHDWVLARWAPWLRIGDPQYDGPKAAPGEILWYVQSGDTSYLVDELEAKRINDAWAKADRTKRDQMPLARSRTFIPAKLSDNPHLQGTGYAQTLNELDPVTRAQLRDGDWLVKPSAGLYFKRQWFKWLETKRVIGQRVRAWDLASVEGGGDWTVGVLMARHEDGTYTIENVVRGRWSPEGVERTILATAAMDGKDVGIRMPQDPGQAGKSQVASYSKLLVGYDVRFKPVSGDKVTRARALSAQVEAGNVGILKGSWNEPFVQTLEAFPEPSQHDDDVDAAADAFNALINQEAVYIGNFPTKRGTEMDGGFDDWDDDDE